MRCVTIGRLFLFALVPIGLLAQTAELSGIITDPSGLAVPERRSRIEGQTAAYPRRHLEPAKASTASPRLLPGSYDLTVEANGFKTVHQNGVVLEVDQRATLDFALTIGSTTETITVEGSAPLLNASDASVSTVIGNRFVENMPLNGRSFSSLIDLAPGVVLTPSNFYEQGQFSVNGQRPDANYFMVDGVSANLGNAGNGNLLDQGGAGQLPATSAFGGTSNLVSLDALEEFRIQTSTFAPEYGRTPGAQISVVTKSGTNTFHGTAFEYFRNDKLDANDWFANRNGSGEARTAAERFRRRAGRPDQERQALLLRLVRRPEGAPASCREYVRAVAGLAPECARSRPAAAQRLPVAERAGPRQRNGRIFGQLLRSLHARILPASASIICHGRVTIFGRYSDAPSKIGQRAGGSVRLIATFRYDKVPDPEPDAGKQPGAHPPVDERVPLQLQPEPSQQLLHSRQFRRRSASSGLGAISIGRFSAELPASSSLPTSIPTEFGSSPASWETTCSSRST